MGTGPNDQESFGANCWGESLGYTQSGIDPEDIVQIPGTPYCWIVDEYNPSAAVVSCDMTNMNQCGTIMMRYTPQGVALPGAGYPVKQVREEGEYEEDFGVNTLRGFLLNAPRATPHSSGDPWRVQGPPAEPRLRGWRCVARRHSRVRFRAVAHVRRRRGQGADADAARAGV
jgi:hypothetical protein